MWKLTKYTNNSHLQQSFDRVPSYEFVKNKYLLFQGRRLQRVNVLNLKWFLVLQQ